MAAVSYASISPKFAQFHQSHGNVCAHILTILIGYMGAGGIATRLCIMLAGPSASGERASGARAVVFGLWIVYAVALLASDVPTGLAARSAAILASVAVVSARLDLSLSGALACIAVGYFLQDAAHLYYGEETYQENSWGGENVAPASMVSLFLEQVFYLLPLTLENAPEWAVTAATCLPAALWAWSNVQLDSDSPLGLPFLAKKSRLLVGKFKTDADVADLAACRSWCVARGPKEETTSHWWMGDLDEATRGAFERLVKSKAMDELFRTKFHEEKYALEPVWGMNELYVSNPLERSGPKTSDDVFFTEHVDGPYCWFPFASVFRCIVALDGNAPGYATHFPNAKRSVEARDGDVLAFDFHRESHYITMKPGGAARAAAEPLLERDPSQKFRMVLKLHYAVAPMGVWWCCGRPLHWLSTRYNEAFRALFLATIAPKSFLEKALADVGVNGTTVAYNAAEKYLGFGNLLCYLVLGAAAYETESYAVFLYGTQFLHYARYVSTFYVRKDVAFGAFKRDVLLFKTVALLQLFALYAAPFLPGGDASTCSAADPCFRPDSLVLICAGYFVSIAATAALGVDGTYFGIELGHVEADYKFVQKFPYNCVPHPMILGQVVALVGVGVVPQVRTARPLLVPCHVLLYLVHLAQEAFDYHDGVPWFEKSKGKTTSSSSPKKQAIAAAKKKKAADAAAKKKAREADRLREEARSKVD